MSIPQIHRKFIKARSFIFDVDGTITPSRGKINKHFHRWLDDFSSREKIYFVTGSDKPKTVEQIGDYLYHQCKAVYQCGGAEKWIGDTVVETSDWKISDELKYALELELSKSGFPLRTGNHIEERSGLCNFSILGRNATLAERILYETYDEVHNERFQIAKRLSEYSDYDFKVAGATGIDITPKGVNKSQILKDFVMDQADNTQHENCGTPDCCQQCDDIYFFGDMVQPGGNDHEIYEAIKKSSNGKVYGVKDWEETWKILKTL